MSVKGLKIRSVGRFPASLCSPNGRQSAALYGHLNGFYRRQPAIQPLRRTLKDPPLTTYLSCQKPTENARRSTRRQSYVLILPQPWPSSVEKQTRRRRPPYQQ